MINDSNFWNRVFELNSVGSNLSRRSCRLQGTHHRSHRRARPTWVVGCGCATAVLYGLMNPSQGLPFGTNSGGDGTIAFMLATRRMPAAPASKTGRWSVTHELSLPNIGCSRSHRRCGGSANTTIKRDRHFTWHHDLPSSQHALAERKRCPPKAAPVAGQLGVPAGTATERCVYAVQDTTSPRLPTGSCGAQTRMDFIRQNSMAALAISGVIASCEVMVPDRASADMATRMSESPITSGTGRNDVVPAELTFERPESAQATPGEDMVWLSEDSGTVVSRLSEVDQTFCQGFVAYLARFLLNYDDGCKRFFQRKLEVAAPRLDGSEQWDEFRGFVASVGYGLGKFRGPEGARELGEALSRKYTTGNRVDNSIVQLAMLLSLLPPGIQPLGTITYLLTKSTAKSSTTSDIAGVDLSILEESPTALLPDALRPVYNEKAKAYFVPGMSSLEKGGEVLLAFGTRGPFPISKERALTAADFGLFAACGALGCTTTHLTVIPLDVVKTRLQTDPGRYGGLVEGVTAIAQEEGPMMLLQGFGPTMMGYLWYGITVYPGYELFKRLFIELLGPLNAGLFRIPLVLAAGASATFFACIGVCPAEAVRIRQVADPSVGGLTSAVDQIVSESGWGKLFEGLPSVLFRQISFGMIKFLVFDFFSDFVYSVLPVLAEQTSTQLTVSLVSGLVAGVCAACVSQPADTVMSVMNRNPGRASIPGTIRTIVGEQGPGGLFLGLGSRIVWSGAIISGQFLLYDLCKTALHVSTNDLRVFLDVIASAGL